jgi:hypothetical protein
MYSIEYKTTRKENMSDEASGFITKNVVLAPDTMKTINSYARKLGLGERGFSAALRLIVEDFKNNKPDQLKGPEYVVGK